MAIQQYQDITEIGTGGLSGIPGLNKQRRKLSTAQVSNIASPEAVTNVGLELGRLGYGNSQYDKEITSLDQAYNIDEFRAQTQPWYDQLANGGLKMITTAATTFIDGTLGTLVGIGTGIYNLTDNDPNTGFWRGMWDNAISNTMADINEQMEDSFKNYMTEWEQNAAFYERMFSAAGAANFWGNDILKNAGFTIGAAAAIYATAGIGGALKGIAGIGRAGEALGLLTRGAKGLELTNAGKIASWIGKTFVSTQGEAAIEAINSVRENRKAMLFNIEQREKQLKSEAFQKYELSIQNGEDRAVANAKYNAELAEINTDINKAKNEMEADLSDAGNVIYAANIAALSISNNLTLGSLIKGGYGPSRELLKQAIKTASGKPIESIKDVGKALLKGDLKFTAPETKGLTGKAIGHWALTSTQEGLEEGVQNLASNTGNIVAQARVNKWVKDNTMLGTMINPDAEETLSSYFNALSEAYQDQFGAMNSPGWTEVAAGFISGALGVPGMHRNNEGKIKPTWQGGFMESLETVNGQKKAIEKQVEFMNKALTDYKFNDRLKHAIQSIAIKHGQDKALEDGKQITHDNYTLQQIVSDATFFKRMGMLDEYLEMVQQFSENITDKDLTELRAAVKNDKTIDATALDQMSDDELKKVYQDNAKSYLDKIKTTLETQSKIEDNWGGKFNEDVYDEAMQEVLFQELLYDDTLNRIDLIDDRIEAMENSESLSPTDKLELDKLRKTRDELEKQLENSSNYLTKVRKNPNILEDAIRKAQTKRRKEELYRDANKAIDAYKEANTVQDVLDIYNHSNAKDREEVLNKAIDQSEGDTKELLKKFSNFMGDYNTLTSLIQEKSKDLPLMTQITLVQALDEMLSSILNDESPVLERDTIKDKMQEYLNKLDGVLEEYTNNSSGIDMSSEQAFQDSVNKALSDGVFNEEDNIEEIINEKDELERRIKEGSELEKAINNAEYAEQTKKLSGIFKELMESLDKLDDIRNAMNKKKQSTSSSKKKTKGKEKKGKKEKKEGKKTSYSEEETTFDDNGEDDEYEDSEPENFDNFGEDEDDDDNSDEEFTESKTELTADDLLTKEEQKYVKLNKKVGDKSGIVYYNIKKINSKLKIPKSVAESLAKKNKVVKNAILNAQMTLANSESLTADDVEKILNKLIDVVSTTIIKNDSIKEVEAILSKYSAYLKPKSAKRKPTEAHENKRGQNRPVNNKPEEEAALNGTQHAGYVTAELTKNKRMVKVTYQASGDTPVQVWMEQAVGNVQKIVDKYLGEIYNRDKNKPIEERVKVYYVKNRNRPSEIFIALDYADVEDIIPRDEVLLVEDKYVLIGDIGYYEDDNIAEESFDTIFNALKELPFEDNSDWVIDTEHTNRLKDMSDGATVKITLSDTHKQVRTLKELLDPTSGRNPHNLGIEDIGFIVVKGDKNKITWEEINVEDKDMYLLDATKVVPGEVYMLIPGATGKLIPVLTEAVYLHEVLDNDDILDPIRQILETLSDSSMSDEDKIQAMSSLRKQLVFSPQNNIFFNDSKNKNYPNTLRIVKNGQDTTLVDFNENDIDVDELLEAIVSLKPRINVAALILERDPEIYVENEVLRTDIGYLGTVNAKLFLYPVKKDLTINPTKPKTRTINLSYGSVLNSIYLNGVHYFTDGDNFFDINGQEIDDPEGILKVVYEIKQEEGVKDSKKKHRPLLYGYGKNKFRYYEINGKLYIETGHGGYDMISEELEKKVRKANKNSSDKKSKEEEIKSETKRLKRKSEEKESQDKRPTQKRTVPKEDKVVKIEDVGIKVEDPYTDSRRDKPGTLVYNENQDSGYMSFVKTRTDGTRGALKLTLSLNELKDYMLSEDRNTIPEGIDYVEITTIRKHGSRYMVNLQGYSKGRNANFNVAVVTIINPLDYVSSDQFSPLSSVSNKDETATDDLNEKSEQQSQPITNSDDVLRVVITYKGKDEFGKSQDWSRTLPDIRNSSDGWGIQNQRLYFKLSFDATTGARSGDNITIWFNKDLSLSERRNIQQLINKAKQDGIQEKIGVDELRQKLLDIINNVQQPQDNQRDDKNTEKRELNNGISIEGEISEEERKIQHQSNTLQDKLTRDRKAAMEMNKLIRQIFKKSPRNINEMLDILLEEKVDISSGDISTITEIIKNCRKS